MIDPSDVNYETMSIEDLDKRYCTERKNILDSVKENSIHVTGLCLYPVKGCRGMSVSSWPIAEYGLYLDRHWCIYSTKTKRFMNVEYELSSLIIHAYLDIEKKLLILASYSMTKNFVITVLDDEFSSLDKENLISLKICGKKTANIFQDCGDGVADWINEALNRDDCRLVRQTQLRDGKLSLIRAQVLLINSGSIEYLAEMVVQEIGHLSTELSEFCWRFRPNIVISGVEPNEENKWKRMTINGLELKVQELCERCKAINGDAERLEYEKYPLKHLQRAGNGRPDFGLLMTICNFNSGMEISVGDELVVNE